jgi:putative salt-induced outer membrane protein YdiY
MRPFSFTLLGMVTLTVCLLAAPESASAGDMVKLKDGSIVYGEIKDMTEGNLRMKIGFALEKTISIKWAEVLQITTDHPLPFRLKDGTVLVGTLAESEQGNLKVKVDPLGAMVPVPLDMVTTINRSPVEFQGNFTLGVAGASGNAELKNVSGLAELVARGDTLRLSLIGRYVYGEANSQVAVRNARGTIKLDFFVTKRFFLFTSAYFEQDTFQDLNLRTALAAGPGYQLIDKGDFKSPYASDMQLYGELGLAYFNEDFKTRTDQTSTRLRFSLKWDWPIIKDKIAAYHYDEFFPSLDNAKDFYLTTDQGLIFNLLENFVAKLQVTYRFNNRPPPGIQSSDTIYLMTFGYSLGK